MRMGYLGLSYSTLADVAIVLIVLCLVLGYRLHRMLKLYDRTLDFVLDRKLMGEFLKEVRPKDY